MQPIYILQPLSSAAATAAEISVPYAGRIKVGRDASNDVAFPHDSRMSAEHFELSGEAGGCRVRDLGSSNGLFLNTKRVVVALLVEGDELQAGESVWRVAVRGGAPAAMANHFAVDDSNTARPPSSLHRSHQVQLGDLQLTTDRGIVKLITPAESLTIGRTPLANWVFDRDGQMSSIHLEIFHDVDAWRVKDLNSSNGTYLNESRIVDSTLRSGDELRAGQTRFVVELLSADQQTYSSPADDPRSAAPRATSDHSPVRRQSSLDSSSLDSSSLDSSSLDSSSLGPSWLRTPASNKSATDHELTSHAERVQAATGHAPPNEQRANEQPVGGHWLSERSGQATAVLRRLSDGREYELSLGKSYQLGRQPDLALAFPDDLQVSTQHATLMYDGQCVRLQDIGSSNGTYVDGRSVVDAQLLDGQRIRVGRTELVVCLPAVPPPQPPPRPQSPPAHVPPAPLPSTAFQSPADGTAQPPEPTRGTNVLDTFGRAAGQTDERTSVDHWSMETPRGWHPPAASQPGSDSQTAGSLPNDASSDESFPIESELLESSLVEASPVETAPLEPSPPTPAALAGSADSVSTEASEGALVAKPASPIESRMQQGPSPSSVVIDWQEDAAYARRANDIQGVVCRSGLYVYRGSGEQLDPVDVGLHVLQSTGGWVLNGSEIDSWMEAARQGLSGQPREWLNPAKSDDASWMLPFLSVWGSGQAWLIFSSLDLDEALHNILSLRPINDAAVPLLPAMHPQALANFLAEHDAPAVQRFFHPLDAILLEVGTDRRWALFSPHDLTSALRR